MKILLLGKNGQLGWELQRSLAPLGELTALDVDSVDYCGDLTDLDGIAKTLRAIKPHVVVNAAAYTAVDKAELEIDMAEQINATAVALLATEAKRSEFWLVHYSTDYVFDGVGEQSWQESDQTGPINVYGQTKLRGENAIRDSGCQHLIFRLSWLYGAHGANFAKTMLKLAQEKQEINVINDQFGAPTCAELVADVTALCIRQALHAPSVSGIYHLVANGVTSWYDYAYYLIGLARNSGMRIKIEQENIKPILTSSFKSLAQRPKNSRMATEKIQRIFGLKLPHWKNGIVRLVSELDEK